MEQNIQYKFIRIRLKRSQDKLDKELAETNVVREDDGGRSKCDVFVFWSRQVGRGSSFIVTALILGVLLFFRSSSPMSLWLTASTLLVGPVLMMLTYIIHWVWLFVIEKGDALFVRGANAKKTAAKNVPLRDGQSE